VLSVIHEKVTDLQVSQVIGVGNTV